jgi:pyruvate/2-oxoglutarate dehydrogenase complex dihydrolipoamide dehydrogenase (E3) component
LHPFIETELDAVTNRRADSISELHTDGYDGQAKIVVDEDRHVMIGATFIGPQVGDLLHAATIAIVGQVPLDRLWHAIPSFSTVNEVWISLLEKYGF